jgi:hypothetical protein
METRALQPALPSLGKVDREIDMSTEGLKTGVIEPSDRTHISGYGPDRQALIAASDSLSNDPFDQEPPNASATESFSDDDRLDLAAGAPVEQARKTDNPTTEIGHPGRHSFWHTEIVVERTARIVASDRRIFVDPSMMLN